jgi:predicted acetylornithine/succinylornithine family transaminase
MTSLFKGEATADLLIRAQSHSTPNYQPAPVLLTRGEGVWVWDRDGRRYLDMVAGIAVCSLGHAHPRLVAAIRDQADKLIHVSNLYYNEPALALMDKLTSLSFGDRVFFCSSGTEANEAALKMARRYQAVVRGAPERSDVLALHKSFHGRTLASLSVTGQPKYHRGFEPMLGGVHFADFGDLAAAEAAMGAGEGRIGTVIVEPVQCEGGLNFPPAGYLRGLRKLCDAQGAVLVFDEVQTGVGRTAEWFYYQLDDVRPDIMSLAKGLGGGVPIGAIVASDEVAKGWEPGSHAATFGGNPLATRAALTVLEVIEEEGLLDHVFEMGEHLGQGLEALAERHGDRCVEARGVGLLRGLELAEGVSGAAVVDRCREQGLLLNAIGGRVLRFVPPLVVQRGHLDAALQILDGVLAEPNG